MFDNYLHNRFGLRAPALSRGTCSIAPSIREIDLNDEQKQTLREIIDNLYYSGRRYYLCNFSPLREQLSFMSEADRANFDATLLIIKNLGDKALNNDSPTAVTEFVQRASAFVNDLLALARSSRDASLTKETVFPESADTEIPNEARMREILEECRKGSTIAAALGVVKAKLHTAGLYINGAQNFAGQEESKRKGPIGFMPPTRNG